MKWYIITLNFILLLSLLLLVIFKLSDQALAVIIGMGLGIFASIPSSLLLFFTITRKEQQTYKNARHNPYQGQPSPPVVVVTSGNQPTFSPPASASPTSAYAEAIPSSRTFTVVGDEAADFS